MYCRVVVSCVVLSLMVCAGCRVTETPSSQFEIEQAELVAKAEPPGADAGREEQEDVVEPTGVVSLREAAAYALMNHPALKAFSHGMRAAEAREVQARVRPNPQIDVEVEEFGGRGARSGFGGSETTIQLGQLIELAGKRAKRARVISLDSELVQWDYESRRLDVVKEVVQAFAGVVAAQERLTLSEQLRDVSRAAHTAVLERVRAGKDSPVEQLRAGVVLSKSEIEVHKAKRALASASQKLAASWGGREVKFERAAGAFYDVAPVPTTDAVISAMAENPDLARWAVEEQQRRAALDSAKAKRVSDVTIAGGVRHFAETDDSAFVLGLAVPLPIFDRNQGGVRVAAERLAKTREEYKTVEIETLAALTAALNDLSSAYDEVGVLRDDVLPKATQALDAASQGYQEGKFDYLYVLDTQRTLFETKVQYIDSVKAYHKARADVERLTGRSIESLALQSSDARTR